ncbi:MAG: hypothetical protein O3A95_02495 [Planctomycetota bacterium]|nr:hypothetical protein [Planctomycetota bacterium]MDA1113152.1 hypothetical protein [Planctomycetota bacterium]
MSLPSLRKLVVPALLGAGIVATLGREVVFALGMGGGANLEVFRLAFGAPNMLGQSMAPTFVGVMLPLLAHAAEKGPDFELRMRQRILRFNYWGVALLCLLGMMPMVAGMILAQGFLGLRMIRFLLLLSLVRILIRWLALELFLEHWTLEGLGMAYTFTEAIALILAGLLFLRRLPPEPPAVSIAPSA